MKLITTIIPAYNAAATLRTTIRSALDQTYACHEIVVVDDGSTDATAAIAGAVAAADPRVRVVSQPNAGLSAARNRGIDEARGDYIAPLDADDLWHPEKLARQAAALAAMPDAALAYGWFRKIDAAGRVLPVSAAPLVEGRVFHRHLDWNFISNGSAPLVRTDVAREIRYDPAMAQGCEDYLFQLRVARHHAFACVPGWLVGYRRVPGSMSTAAERMIRAHLQMYAAIAPEADAAGRAIITERVAWLNVELARNRLRRGRLVEGAGRLARAAVRPRIAAAAATAQVREAARRRREGMFAAPARPFADYALTEADGSWHSGRSPARDARLFALDAASG